jgi:murein DD-endopeptidase MepM/ murein hydrolase activator NlpD
MNLLKTDFLFILFLLLPWAVACNAESAALANVRQEQELTAEQATVPEIVEPTINPSPTPLNPPVVVEETAVPPADIAVGPPATATPHPTVETAARTTVTDNEEAAETAVDSEPTETPIPTFTPPALPFTTAEDHYWLRRPVPEGGVVWTDKVYPYGGTRGGSLRPHHGVEFVVPSGTPMLAAASGTVIVAGDDMLELHGPQPNFYGQLIIIELDSRYQGQPVYILYGHLSEIWVRVGQQVQVGDVIGLSGGSGVADGPHLHFEVRLGQNSYEQTRNPLLWIYPFPDYGAVAGRVTWPDGSLAYEVPVSLRRLDASSRYLATTTYAGDTTNPTELWQENFALDDVPAGYYEVTVRLGQNRRITEEIWVFAYRTSFVEIVLDE